MAKGVASVAEFVDDMHFGTANGPTRLGLELRVVSAAVISACVLGPPEPIIMPVIGWDTSSAESPESAMACSIAT